MSIKSRLPKIKGISQQATELVSNRFRSAWSVISTSSKSHYQIRLKWDKKGRIEDIEHFTITCQCQKVTGPGMVDCKGNSNGTVCYHSLGSFIKMTKKNGSEARLFDNFSDAFRYSNFGGKLVKVVSQQGEGVCWAVVSKIEKPKDSFQNRVNMMRGEVEKGID